MINYMIISMVTINYLITTKLLGTVCTVVVFFSIENGYIHSGQVGYMAINKNITTLKREHKSNQLTITSDIYNNKACKYPGMGTWNEG